MSEAVDVDVDEDNAADDVATAHTVIQTHNKIMVMDSSKIMHKHPHNNTMGTSKDNPNSSLMDTSKGTQCKIIHE